MLSNKLQMNEDKTEVLLVTPKRVAKSEPLPEFMNINGICVKFCLSIRNLGVTLDSTLSLHQHVLNICKSAFLELRRINYTYVIFCLLMLYRLLSVHSFCHALTIAILYLLVHLIVSLRRYNMYKMLQPG